MSSCCTFISGKKSQGGHIRIGHCHLLMMTCKSYMKKSSHFSWKMWTSWFLQHASLLGIAENNRQLPHKLWASCHKIKVSQSTFVRASIRLQSIKSASLILKKKKLVKVTIGDLTLSAMSRKLKKIMHQQYSDSGEWNGCCIQWKHPHGLSWDILWSLF